MEIIKNGVVTSPKGFKATGFSCGIKNDGQLDLALIYSEVPAGTAIVTTTNVVKAAPILWCKEVMKTPFKQGIVINSGNANACTGDKGFTDVLMTAKAVGEVLNIPEDRVLVASTGVIGVPLPLEKMINGIREKGNEIGNADINGEMAADAILTTDTIRKNVGVEIEIDGVKVKIAGMAKGSGMIHPNMATMLSFITTDAAIHPDNLQELLNEVILDTYNMISVDGDTSTNDMVTVMANGLAGNKPLIKGSEDYRKFKEAFHYVNKTLAKKIIRDGEGATKFIDVKVRGAKTIDDARALAKSVITSSLVKTAIFGEDANWGRVLCALGYSGVTFDPMKVSLVFSSAAGMITLLVDGIPIAFEEKEASKVLSETDITIIIEMEEGQEKAVAWGCDLSYDYVKINGDYRS
ncbi:MAG: bifunctional glutamate N-acetyltransferase/amino-acid acetyltransferase ArgJ [Eubacteriaceae bacterium]